MMNELKAPLKLKFFFKSAKPLELFFKKGYTAAQLCRKGKIMQIQEIISRLKVYTGKHPTEALLVAIEKKEAIIPVLLDSIDHAIADTQGLLDEDSLPLWSLYLLAQFRCQQAFPKLLQFARLPAKRLDNLIGDTLTEGLKNILASTFDEDLEGLIALVLDKGACIWARNAALLSIPIMVKHNLIQRDRAIEVFERLFLVGLEVERSLCILNYSLARACVSIRAREFSSQITDCFAKGLITKEYDTLENMLHELEHGDKWPDKENLIDDVVKETDWWACFNESPVYEEDSDVNQPFVREQGKIGRNDPCPCASGKKYKKCCLAEARAMV
jgi:hypothetical protein